MQWMSFSALIKVYGLRLKTGREASVAATVIGEGGADDIGLMKRVNVYVQTTVSFLHHLVIFTPYSHTLILVPHEQHNTCSYRSYSY